MAYDEIKSIQTIAKTPIIEDKLNKIYKSYEELVKKEIQSQKVLQVQNKNSSVNGTPIPASNAVQGATDAAGNVLQYPLAPPVFPNPTNSNNPTKTNTSDTAQSQSGPGSSPNQTTADPSETDKSDAGKESSQGGSDANQQAKKGADDAELQEIITAMEFSGLPADFIADFIKKYVEEKYSKPNTHEISDIVDGLDGPKITYSSPPSANYNGDIDNIAGHLEAIVGLDPVNAAIAVVVNLIPKSYIPSIKDAFNANQNPWESYDYGPIKKNYIPGAYFTPGYTNDVDQAIAEVIANVPTAGNFVDWYADTPSDAAADHLPGGNEQPSLQFYVTREGGGPDFLLAVSMSFCDRTLGTGSGAAACAASAPRETTWPQTATYILNLFNGKFIGSVFDTELPDRLKYNNPSSVTLANSKDGRLIDILPGVGGGTIIIDSTYTKDGLYYDSKGQLRAVVPLANLNFYLPSY